MAQQLAGSPVIIDPNHADYSAATTTPKRYMVKNSRGKESFSREMTFTNRDATNALLVSFDGKSFMSIPANTNRRFIATVTTFIIQSSAGSVAWDVAMAVA